ncbi:MAG: hypothetical protein JSS76_17535 [Bacteroidetes bacterium]|nr:hypothetical protein [Bacteroidota bacterium]
MKSISLFFLLSFSLTLSAQKITLQEEYDLIHNWGALKYLDPQLSSGVVNMDSLLLSRFYSSPHRLEAPASLFTPHTNKTFYTTGGCKSLGICFKNEKIYPTSCIDSAGYRVLLIARFWTIMRYMAPDRRADAARWDSVLMHTLHCERDVHTRAAFDTLLLQLSAQTEDPHSSIFGGAIGWLGEKFSPPIDIAWIDSGYYISAAYDSAYTRYIGSHISAINGQPVQDFITSQERYIAGKGQAYISLHISSIYLLPGDSGSTLQLSLQNGERIRLVRSLPYDMYMAQKRESQKHDEQTGLSRDSILYINLHHPVRKSWLRKQLKLAKATILDIRQYPDWSNANILPYFLDKKAPGCKSMFADLKHLALDETYAQRWPARAGHPVRIFILITESTISRSEYFAAILKTYNSTACLVGRQTVGAMGEFLYVPMYGDLSTGFTFGEVTFEGRSYFKKGLTPDLVVYPQPEDLHAGHDRLLDAAMERAKHIGH